MASSNPHTKFLPRAADFYNGKSVFLTGASGFVGSVLLEVLLRCCLGIKCVYILLRPKKDLLPEARKEQIFNKKVFEKLKAETPELLQKVHAIPGDISLSNLGMNEKYVQLVIEEVSVLFHCAAVVNFTKPLKFMLMNNVGGLKNVIELCRKMRTFEALVFTSTAYSNCNHINCPLKEEVHRLPFHSEKFLDALKNEDIGKLHELISYCKPDWPNTYTFTKCLAENVIMDTASDLPVAIIRPSIVFSTWKHPVPGYVEVTGGFVTLFMGGWKSFIKVFHADPNCRMNLVPVDIVANTHVVAAMCVGRKRCVSPLVVNCSATPELQLRVSQLKKVFTEMHRHNPHPLSLEKNTYFFVIRFKYLYYIAAVCHHYLLAIFLDGILRIIRQKARLCTLYQFYDSVMSVVNFFIFHTFEFERKNLEYLDQLIHSEDRKNLTLDFRKATILEMSLALLDGSSIYDKKFQLERQRMIYMRHAVSFFRGMVLMNFFLLIYWVFSFIFQ